MVGYSTVVQKLEGLVGALLICGLCAGCTAEELRLVLVPREVVLQRLQAGQVREKERQGTIAQLFNSAACETSLQRVDRSSSNVICTLAGKTTAEIVVGGHFDFVERGEGIVDDWSGTSLLPSLYEALKGEPTKHTFKFVAFTEEERGLIGSTQFVRELTAEQRTDIKAFVNLECLGLAPPKVWVHRSTPTLLQDLAQIAKAVSIPVQGVDVDRVGDDDTHPFLNKKIPVISIHSLTQETLPILHSPRDTIKAINTDYFYEAYRLVAFYLKYLDGQLD